MIWIIGGTANTADILDNLKGNYNLLLTTATDLGKQVSSNYTELKIISKKLKPFNMKHIIKKNKVKLVIDASHPYAINVSKNAYNSAKLLNIPYIRFERKEADTSGCIIFDNYKDAATYLVNKQGNILLTIGIKNLIFFKNLPVNRLFVRVLPVEKSIQQCRKYGIYIKNIIAVYGVCSVNFNKSILQEYNIKYLVTKESGIEGGFLEKTSAAQLTGTQVLVIRRPKINVEPVFYDIINLIEYVEQLISSK